LGAALQVIGRQTHKQLSRALSSNAAARCSCYCTDGGRKRGGGGRSPFGGGGGRSPSGGGRRSSSGGGACFLWSVSARCASSWAALLLLGCGPALCMTRPVPSAVPSVAGALASLACALPPLALLARVAPASLDWDCTGCTTPSAGRRVTGHALQMPGTTETVLWPQRLAWPGRDSGPGRAAAAGHRAARRARQRDGRHARRCAGGTRL